MDYELCHFIGLRFQPVNFTIVQLFKVKTLLAAKFTHITFNFNFFLIAWQFTGLFMKTRTFILLQKIKLCF